MAALLGRPGAQDYTYTWTTTSGNWNVAADWSTAPRTDDVVVFNESNNTGADTVYLNGAEAASSLDFVTTGGMGLLGGGHDQRADQRGGAGGRRVAVAAAVAAAAADRLA